ncbi:MULTISPECIES: DUF3298 and DUF4163 domain-containing protein [Sphingobacterium]|uniref:DUF3298 and DUF4163 domain-containing protein n=1 Tax=Sphingobacterium TaxID=28453 RepID=UPI0013DD6F33|nr:MULTISPECIES: DUF3298 and DUF4163 domain-containing protein [unclassified Sphingobacterium]
MRSGILFIFIFVALSCANERTKSKSSVNLPELATKDTVNYSYQTKREISSYFVGDSTHIDTAYYQITYPIFADKEIDKALQEAIFIDRENNADDAAISFLNGYNEFVEESSTTAIHSAWYKKLQSQIILNTPLFLTLQTSIQEYTGGAHGNHVTIFTVFDTDRLKKLSLWEIIVTGGLKVLTKKAEAKFRKQESLSDTSSLIKDFFFEDGIFALNDNFGLTKDRLIIYYNEYEIKPYSEGITVIELPYDDISDILNERGKRYIDNIQQ